MRAAGVRLRSTASSPPPSSMTSTRRLGLPTCWRACRITPPSAFTNSCLGIGALRTSLTPPKRSQLFAQNDLTRVLAGGVRILQSSARILHLLFDGRILAETVSDWTWIKISDFDRVKEVLFVNHWGFTRGSACPSQPSPAPWLSRWPALA